MAKLISCAVFVLLAMTGLGNPALAQPFGVDSSLAVCQLFEGGHITEQDGGLFAVGPASCGIEKSALANIVTQPSVFLDAKADTADVPPASGSGAGAQALLQYTFQLSGGNPGDLVPILVHTHLITFVDQSDDPNNANAASAIINLYALPSLTLGPNTFACDDSPNQCSVPSETEEDLALTMASGSKELVWMQVIVAASSLSGGAAYGEIDPYIFVDPHFANAADYTITVTSAGVANAPAVPEPGVWALLLAGLGGLGVAVRRR